jgi:hypothetical protein
MPSFKRQIERKVSAQAAIRQIKNFIKKICMEVTPLIDRIARNTAELSDTTCKVAKDRNYQSLSFVLQK